MYICMSSYPLTPLPCTHTHNHYPRTSHMYIHIHLHTHTYTYLYTPPQMNMCIRQPAVPAGLGITMVGALLLPLYLSFSFSISFLFLISFPLSHPLSIPYIYLPPAPPPPSPSHTHQHTLPPNHTHPPPHHVGGLRERRLHGPSAGLLVPSLWSTQHNQPNRHPRRSHRPPRLCHPKLQPERVAECR